MIMKNWDAAFICSNLASLSGIPLRLFRDGTLVALYAMVPLPADPFTLYSEEILASGEAVRYHITPYGHYYGVIQHGSESIVTGPLCPLSPNQSELRETAFLLGLQGKQIDAFIGVLRSIPLIGVESFLRMICLVHYYLSGEKKSVTELAYHDLSADTVPDMPQYDESETPGEVSGGDVHNTLSYESRMLDYIRLGDTVGLSDLFLTSSHGKEGRVALNQLRQAKNTFIITATLVSRAAVDGGVSPEDALSLSDMYIQQCELLTDYQSVSRFQWRMVMDYAERTERIRHGRTVSPFVLEVLRYIREHLFGAVHVQEMANVLHVNRSHLTTRFKRETGITLTEYIRGEKISEAKRLLSLTQSSIQEITIYLGFSSQSHFGNVFKAVTGMTPREYRQTGEPD